jgi:predicted transcriptional regulator of viral defense system
MGAVEKVCTLMKERGGYLRSNEAHENGLTNKTLQRLAERGLIERVAHGLYASNEIIPDPFFIAQRRCPLGVFSHETALFFHGLSDRMPFRLMMTIPSGWNTRLLSDNGIRIFYCKPKHAKLGAMKATTPYGRTVAVYDAQRTICDCLRSIDKLDRDLVLTALKRQLKEPSCDKAKLLEYAAIFNIRDMVYRYLEVLA